MLFANDFSFGMALASDCRPRWHARRGKLHDQLTGLSHGTLLQCSSSYGGLDLHFGKPASEVRRHTSDVITGYGKRD